jgi:hypothetical protein
VKPTFFLAPDLPWRTALRRALSVLLPALAALAWVLPGPTLLGPALSPLILVGVMLADSPLWRFLAALAYFGVGGSALPSEVQSFFGSGWVIGIGLWVLSSVILAAPWAWASRGWRVVVVLLIEAVPPLGFFGWLSPLATAGVLYPGLGLVGFALGLALLWVLAVLARPASTLTALTLSMVASVVLSGASVWANAAYTPPEPPAGWIGVSTHVGRESGDVMADVARNQQWIDQAAAAVAQEAQAGAKKGLVVALPEDVAGTWGPGTAAQVRASVAMRCCSLRRCLCRAACGSRGTGRSPTPQPVGGNPCRPSLGCVPGRRSAMTRALAGLGCRRSCSGLPWCCGCPTSGMSLPGL